MSIKHTMEFIDKYKGLYLEMRKNMQAAPKWKYTVCYYAEGGRLMYESIPLLEYPTDDQIDLIYDHYIKKPVRELIVRAQVQKYRYYK